MKLKNLSTLMILIAAFLSTLGLFQKSSYSLESKAANPDHIKQLQETGQCPRCNLRGADLKGIDLYRINAETPFYREDRTSGVVLNRANLSGADLRGADLSKATLIGADMRGARLSEAKLSASLTGADLRGADLTNADLKGAGWTKVKIDDTTKISAKWKLVWEIVNYGVQGRNLSGVDFKDATLVYEDWWRNRFQDYAWNGRFEGSDRSEFRGANLSGANLSGAYLRGMNLEGANLSKANLEGAFLRNTRLVRANLTFANLKYASMMGADVSYANLKDAEDFSREAQSFCYAILPDGKVLEPPYCS